MAEIIFISGRFRSGTSMLWNIFNQLPQYCAYYEPLHPNLLSHIQYVKPKQDHLGVEDYWHSYSRLDNISDYYSANFGQSRLFMEKHEKYGELKKYIQYLITSSGERTPVLKFNRMDLRLSWLKNTFPESTIITIDREAYPLWISSRKHLNTDEDKNNESYPDAYDLMQWSVDLATDFPMLQSKNDRSSYYRHYFIWKLSQILAKENADIQLSLENDFWKSSSGLKALAKQFDWGEIDIQTVKKIVHKPNSFKSEVNKDKEYLEIEKNIEITFKKLGLTKLFPSSLLSEIKIEFESSWKKHPFETNNVIQELLNAMRFQKDELTAIVN